MFGGLIKSQPKQWESVMLLWKWLNCKLNMKDGPRRQMIAANHSHHEQEWSWGGGWVRADPRWAAEVTTYFIMWVPFTELQTIPWSVLAMWNSPCSHFCEKFTDYLWFLLHYWLTPINKRLVHNHSPGDASSVKSPSSPHAADLHLFLSVGPSQSRWISCYWSNGMYRYVTS